MDTPKDKILREAISGTWFVTPCSTWSEERKLLATIPLLMTVLEEARRVSLLPGADEELSAAVFRAIRAIKS
jgi:hypothetical protein